MNEMPEWECDLRAALVEPAPPGQWWHRPDDWTVDHAVEAMRPHFDKNEKTMQVFKAGIVTTL